MTPQVGLEEAKAMRPVKIFNLSTRCTLELATGVGLAGVGWGKLEKTSLKIQQMLGFALIDWSG